MIKENTAIGAINGLIAPGTDATNTGFANADEPTSTFSGIWDIASHNASLTVSITYDDSSFVITDIEVAASQMLVDAKPPNSP